MNETASDQKPKIEPKVTLEKAVELLKPKVETLLKETLAGFELDPADKKSRKRIFGALVTSAAAYMLNTEKLSLSSLGRRCSRALSSLQPTTYAINTDETGESENYEGDESDE